MTPSAGTKRRPDHVVIRVAKPDDSPAIYEIETAAFTHDRLSRRMLARHLRSDSAQVFAATLDGAIVGYCLTLYRQGADVARLYSVAIAPAARGKGAGRRLLETCERAARKRGCHRVRLEVRETNTQAIALYRKLGYQAIGRYEAYYEDGAPALRLEKTLD